MPDYFDRLVARATPDREHAGPVPRVRPRLPGPFERVDTLGVAPPSSEEDRTEPRPSAEGAPPLPRLSWPVAPSAAERPADRPAPTVPRPEVPLTAEPSRRPAPLLAPPPVPPRVAAPAVPPPGRRADPTPRPVGPAPTRPTGREQDERRSPTPAEPGRTEPARRPAPPAAVPGTDRSGGARRQRPGERIVRVQIGRIEVRAAERAPAPPRRSPAARPAPALDLGTYLQRERP